MVAIILLLTAVSSFLLFIQQVIFSSDDVQDMLDSEIIKRGKTQHFKQGTVVHTCKPSALEGRGGKTEYLSPV